MYNEIALEKARKMIKNYFLSNYSVPKKLIKTRKNKVILFNKRSKRKL